jgi:hypothetical protein
MNSHLKFTFINVGGMTLLGGALMSMASLLIPHYETKMVLKIASAMLGVLGGGIYLVGFFAPDDDASKDE